MGTEITTITAGAPVENLTQESLPTVHTHNTQSPKNMSRSQAENLVKDINKSMQSMGTQVSFSVDNDSGHVVIKVIDTTTKEVLRQIPPEEILRVSENIKKLLGVRVDQVA